MLCLYGGIEMETSTGRQARDFGRLIRFSIVGGLTALIYLAILNSAAQLSGWRLSSCSLIAYPLATAFNYFLHRAWTFQDRRKAGGGTVVRYLIVVVGCAALNAGLLSLPVHLNRLETLAYEAMALCLVIGVTFVAMNLWVWTPAASVADSAASVADS